MKTVKGGARRGSAECSGVRTWRHAAKNTSVGTCTKVTCQTYSAMWTLMSWTEFAFFWPVSIMCNHVANSYIHHTRVKYSGV